MRGKNAPLPVLIAFRKRRQVGRISCISSVGYKDTFCSVDGGKTLGGGEQIGGSSTKPPLRVGVSPGAHGRRAALNGSSQHCEPMIENTWRRRWELRGDPRQDQEPRANRHLLAQTTPGGEEFLPDGLSGGSAAQTGRLPENSSRRSEEMQIRQRAEYRESTSWSHVRCLRLVSDLLIESPNDSPQTGEEEEVVLTVGFACDVCLLQENFFDIQEALQAIHMRQEMLREQLACAKSKGEETVGRNLQVGRFPPDSCSKIKQYRSRVSAAWKDIWTKYEQRVSDFCAFGFYGLPRFTVLSKGPVKSNKLKTLLLPHMRRTQRSQPSSVVNI